MDKLDYRLRKPELGLYFLCTRDDYKVVPKFLNFRGANNHLKYSFNYNKCKYYLLREEIRLKEFTVQNLQK